MELILSMILIVFAVFGLYCLTRLAWEWCYTPKGLRFALAVETREDVLCLNARLTESLARLSVPRGVILVLIPEELLLDGEIRRELYGELIGFDAEVIPYRTEK